MKFKTSKSITKRIRKTGKGKILKKTTGQDHFNAKDTGKKTRQKRKQHGLSKTLNKVVRTYTPYN